MSGKKSPKAKSSGEEKRVKEMQDFLEHLGAYVIVILMLAVLNVATSFGDWWFQWVAFFWGIGLAFHAADVFLDDGGNLARDLVRRRSGQKTEVPPTTTTVVPPTNVPGEVREIVEQGTALVDRMRGSARIIPSPEARTLALQACSSSDQVLSAIADHPDELPLARDFIHQFLAPAEKLVGDYARLASRDVPSARETLRAVEENDLPQLVRRADALYDRMHRGTLIDLEVAREMMSLDTPTPVDSETSELPRTTEPLQKGTPSS